MKQTRRYLLRGIGATAILLLGALVIALSNARVELTEHGAHRRLLVPIGIGMAGLNTFAGTGDKVHIPGFLDGPMSASWQTAVGRRPGSVKTGCSR
ncbi:hypothetical protein [Massilia varians]|uniref:hypothetical protein n=1 Tax=Massilia varians TaxID=457921 RepID=UPI00248FC1DE|nr:hypothetical protein [Massilia varians]